jgi:hypothetical protein
VGRVEPGEAPVTDLDDLALHGVVCPFCGAARGEWCRTARPTKHAPGRRTTWLHTDRLALLWEAWQAGNESGQASAYGNVAQRLEGALRGAFWARDMPTDAEGILRWLRAAEERARA